MTNSRKVLIISMLSLFALMGQSAPTLAQMRGEGTQNFFDRGDRQLQQEIQQLQQPQQQNPEVSKTNPEPLLNVEGNTPQDSQVKPNPPTENPDATPKPSETN